MSWTKASWSTGGDRPRSDRWTLPAHGPDASGVRRRPTAPIESSDDDRLFDAFVATERMTMFPTPLVAIRFALGLLRDLIPSEVAFGSLYDIDDHVLRIVWMDPAAPLPESPNGRTLPVDAGLVARALATLAPPLRLVNDAGGKRLATADGERPVRNVIFMPLRTDGRLLGLVHLVNRDGREFTAGDAAVLSYVGDRLAETIHTARCSL